MRAAVLALLAVGLAACSPQERLPAGANVTRAVPKPGVATPAAQGEMDLVVRTFAPDRSEITGARCVAESGLYSAETVSPARILMPYYGAQSPQVSVSCTAGSASGRVEVAPEPFAERGLGGWPAVGVSVGTGGGGNGVGVGMGWYGGGYGSSQSNYRYPSAHVVLN